MNKMRLILLFIQVHLLFVQGAVKDTAVYPEGKSSVFEALKQISSSKQLVPVKVVDLAFQTFHPQGMVKIGDYFYLSAVDVRRWPRSYRQKQNGYDRDEGEGIGHLFKFDVNGQLVDSIQLGESAIYHPGGIDFDGQSIWVPVCEYRPYGASLIYCVDPLSMKVKKMIRCEDAIGALVYNRERREIVGMNWGAEKFYKWKWEAGSWTLKSVEKNLHQVIHYQDAQYIGNQQMICSGHRTYTREGEKQGFSLGGIQVLDLSDYRSVYILPVELWTPSGLIMTANPFFIEKADRTLFFYFIPEDNHSKMYIYKYTP